jgi:hypothetical protein
MPLVEIDWHPGPKQLRVFGLSGFVASAVLAAVLVLVWGVALAWALVALAAGLAILICSLVSLGAARYLYIVLTVVALPIGFLVSLVLLAVFYFLLLTPVGLLFRLIGRDPLCRRFDSSRESYWVARKSPGGPDRYFHQF